MGQRVLVAFDSFKGALSAETACRAAADAIAAADGHFSVDQAPVSDGGEGFGRILTCAAGGVMRRFQVTGPDFRPVEAEVGLVEVKRLPSAARALLPPKTPEDAVAALIEMAAASGLPLLPEYRRNPWRTTSRGTGELIRSATDSGASIVILGVGGSGTSDLGLGALEVFGLRFLDENGRPVDEIVPEHWPRVVSIEGRVSPRPSILIACDVTNPLLGENGAAAIYGPQKGLPASDIARFDGLAATMARLLCENGGVPFAPAATKPGAGAAGGIVFGLRAAFAAQSVPGFDLVSAWLDLPARMAKADVVVTGEGCTDSTSFSGKAVGRIIEMAQRVGRRCIVFSGANLDSPRMGEERITITPAGMPLDRALVEAEQNLSAAVRRRFAAGIQPK